MNTDPFLELLMKNDESEIKEYIRSNGKKPKPVSPIYFFSDLSKEDLEKMRKEYNMQEDMI